MAEKMLIGGFTLPKKPFVTVTDFPPKYCSMYYNMQFPFMLQEIQVGTISFLPDIGWFNPKPGENTTMTDHVASTCLKPFAEDLSY